VVSAAAGAGVTFLLVKKHYEEVANFEIDTFKDEYLQRQQQKAEAQDIARENSDKKQEMTEMIGSLGYDDGHDEADRIKEGIEQSRNIFDDAQDPGWDQETEEANRDEKPYIISAREYSEAHELTHVDLEYFAGDDILVDDKNYIIPDTEPLIGEDTLNCFGHGSNDPHLVFVQNDELETVFQIHYNPGMYERAVHGVIEHSDKPQLRKFRLRD
jgi:hypothetical protein